MWMLSYTWHSIEDHKNYLDYSYQNQTPITIKPAIRKGFYSAAQQDELSWSIVDAINHISYNYGRLQKKDDFELCMPKTIAQILGFECKEI